MSEIAFARSAPPYLSEASVPRASARASNPMSPASTKKQREACSMWSRTRSRGVVRSSTRCSTLIRRQGATRTTSADRLLRHIEARGSPWNGSSIPIRMQTTLHWLASYLKDMTGAPTAIGDRVTEVQKILENGLPSARDLPDRRVAMGSSVCGRRTISPLARFEARALLSPGHTLCSMTYVTGDAAFVHDTVFMPDPGTARTPIFPEATRLRSGGAFNGFSSCPTTRACLPAMTIVQAVGKRAGKAPSLSRRRTISI